MYPRKWQLPLCVLFSVVHLLVYEIEVQLSRINLTKILNEWNLYNVLKLVKEFKKHIYGFL